MKRNKENRALIVKCCVLGVMLLLIVFSKLLFGRGDVVTTSQANIPPCLQHPFGTDNLGRDLLCRSFIGLRLSLLMAFIMQVICMTLGVTIGTVVGYSGGVLDKIFVFLQNVILSFPGALKKLVDYLWSNDIIGCYGKQLSMHEHSLDAWQRERCYPNFSHTKRLKDVPRLQLLTPFCSNAFTSDASE